MIRLELQLDKTSVSCLQRLVNEVQNQEQTQEVRINDGMPDVGRVLGAWGQVLLRSKEWHTNEIIVTGGVMAWVLYVPEDSNDIQCVETWLPFQTKFSFADRGKDGIIQARCLLRSVDARSTSARKLMVRACVGVLCEAAIQADTEIFSPGELPADIQLLRKTYPMKLPKEAGEKQFAMDEELSLPGSCPPIEKLICYELRPECADQKVIAGKAVFRGLGILHILYCSEDGGLHSWDFEIPFSQYTELDNDYEEGADISFCFSVTGLELDCDGNTTLRLKAGVTGQYTVYDDMLVEIIEDAYSPERTVSLQTAQLQLPAVLDKTQQTVKMEQVINAECSRVADLRFYPDHAQLRRSVDSVEVVLPGVFQMTYYDPEGAVQCSVVRAEETRSFPSDQNCGAEASVLLSGKPQAVVTGGAVSLRGDILLELLSDVLQGMNQVSGLELGDLKEPADMRPSLILRRAGGDTLWNIAKSTGSTVEAIKNANRLQNEPEQEQMLLIPIQ